MCMPFILCREANAFRLAFFLFLEALRLEFMMHCKGHGKWAFEKKTTNQPAKKTPQNPTLKFQL